MPCQDFLLEVLLWRYLTWAHSGYGYFRDISDEDGMGLAKKEHPSGSQSGFDVSGLPPTLLLSTTDNPLRRTQYPVDAQPAYYYWFLFLNLIGK